RNRVSTERQEAVAGGAAADVLVRRPRRMALRLPGRTGLRDRLERAGLVLAPHRQSQRRGGGVRVPHQLLLAAASGSVTAATPDLRRRVADPVGHPVRVRWNVYPAARSTCQMVNVETLGSPSGAARRTRRRIVSDHVAVPSAAAVGGRATSRR